MLSRLLAVADIRNGELGEGDVRPVDWQRQRYGRTRWTFGNGRVYERRRPELVSLDDADNGRRGAAAGENGGF
jgi:hypothetical protein